jgi:hypothetical protein
MRVQPRQQILDVWRATARSSFEKDSWLWGGRDGSNSISDAEHLLCLMGPATDLPAFRLDRPDETAEDILRVLRPLGDSVEIPQVLIRVLGEYLRRYTDENGSPVFPGGSYFRSSDAEQPPTPQQQALDVVDSLAISVSLMLATIGFVRVFRSVVRRAELHRDIEAVEEMAGRRLSAAMVGLLRSFTVYVFDVDSDEGREMVRTANQNDLPDRVVVEELREELREIRAGLRDEVIIGSGAGQGSLLDNPNQLFECGWSWGIVRDAPQVQTTFDVGEQRLGVAQPAPYLYFTVVALEAIQSLFSERTRLLGLLNEEQQRLAQALQLRWDLTQSYWSRIARFGSGRWPLEDLPWRTTDRIESDYFSLLVTSIVVQDLVGSRGSDEDLSRVGQVIDDLASRGRITRRAFPADPALRLHSPGETIELVGSEETGEGPVLHWVMSDLSPLLLQRTVRIAGLLGNPERRQRLLNLADDVWTHIDRRRLRADPGRDLWDQPKHAFAQVSTEHKQPSWYYTKRVVDCLITAANVISSPPVRSPVLSGIAGDLLNEAEHLFDQELLDGSSEGGPSVRAQLDTLREKLRRARRLLRDQPGTAAVLATDVLGTLDNLAAAREDAAERT